MELTTAPPKLLKVSQAAQLLNVSERTVRRWIEKDKIPYLELPGREYRIPQGALLASLRGNYHLAGELAKLDQRDGDIPEDEAAGHWE